MDSFTAEQRALFDAELPALRTLMEQLQADGFERSACKAARKSYHPDKNKGKEKVFTELFKILSDFIDSKGHKKSEEEKPAFPDEGDFDFEDFDDDAFARGEDEAEEAPEGEEEEFDSREDFARAHPDAEELYERELGGGSSRKKRRRNPPEEEQSAFAQNSEEPVNDYERDHIAFNHDANRQNYVFIVVHLPSGHEKTAMNRGAVRALVAVLKTKRNTGQVKEAMISFKPAVSMLESKMYALIWIRSTKLSRNAAAVLFGKAFTDELKDLQLNVYLSNKPMFTQQNRELFRALKGQVELNSNNDFIVQSPAGEQKTESLKQQREKKEAKAKKDAEMREERERKQKARDEKREEKEMKRSNSFAARKEIQLSIRDGKTPAQIWAANPDLLLIPGMAREAKDWHSLEVQASIARLPSALPFTMTLTDSEGYDVKVRVEKGTVDPITCRDEALKAKDKCRHWIIIGPANSGKSDNIARFTRGTRTCMFGTDTRYPFEKYTGTQDLLICNDALHGIEFQDIIQACDVQYNEVSVKVRYDTQRFWEIGVHRTVMIVGNARALAGFDFLEKGEYKARFNEVNLYRDGESLASLRCRYVADKDNPIWEAKAPARKFREREEMEVDSGSGSGSGSQSERDDKH